MKLSNIFKHDGLHGVSGASKLFQLSVYIVVQLDKDHFPNIKYQIFESGANFRKASLKTKKLIQHLMQAHDFKFFPS